MYDLFTLTSQISDEARCQPKKTRLDRPSPLGKSPPNRANGQRDKCRFRRSRASETAIYLAKPTIVWTDPRVKPSDHRKVTSGDPLTVQAITGWSGHNPSGQKGRSPIHNLSGTLRKRRVDPWRCVCLPGNAVEPFRTQYRSPSFLWTPSLFLLFCVQSLIEISG